MLQRINRIDALPPVEFQELGKQRHRRRTLPISTVSGLNLEQGVYAMANNSGAPIDWDTSDLLFEYFLKVPGLITEILDSLTAG